MSLTTYCSAEEIRSALGVNSLELKDTVLGLPVYEMGLVRELNKLSTSLNAAFSTVALLESSTWTTTQKGLYDAVRLFSVYAVAKQVGVSLANFAPKEISDGKASVARFAGTPFEAVLARVDDMYVALRVDLGVAYTAFTGVDSASKGSIVPLTMFVASKRGVDPVTGV